MLFLGFSAGIPILLIFSSLSLWLREAGVSKTAVTFFSWAALGYSFKFVWAPLIDKLPLPILSAALGRRRGWLLLSQCLVIAAISWMASLDPQTPPGLFWMAVAAVMLGFSSATQDIVIDAFRIESAQPKLQSMLAATYIAGYRVATIVAGAGALYLAQFFGSTAESYSYEAWRNAYFYMAGCMLIGIITTLVIAEPQSTKAASYPYATGDYVQFVLMFMLFVAIVIGVFLLVPAPDYGVTQFATLLRIAYNLVVFALALACALIVANLCLRLGLMNRSMLQESYQAPVVDFFKRYGRLALWVLLLVGFYRISDIVLGVIANVFYQDRGYSKAEIASVTKVFGVVMTITGSFLGGLLVLRIGIMRMLIVGAILVASTNLLFMWLAQIEPKIAYLTLVIAADNLSQGVAIAAFIAWLSSLTNVSFTAMQYAIFSSLMTLFPKLLGGYSGTVVEAIGYSWFFFLASLLGVPVIVLIYFLRKRLGPEQASG